MRMGSEIGHKARNHDDAVVKMQCVCIGQEAEGLVLFDTDREKVLSSHESVTTTLSEWDGCVRNCDPSPFAKTTISVEFPLADSGARTAMIYWLMVVGLSLALSSLEAT